MSILTIPNKSLYKIQRMEDKDAPLFVSLLYSVYGDTYSYKELYNINGYLNLINSKNILCYGFFDEKKRLIGHTALKYNKRDYCYYSFLSMKKWIRSNDNENLEKIRWKNIINNLAKNAFLLYQNTTTSHLLAQKYASNFLYSNPIGFIFNYTEGERYKSIQTNNYSMHCLVQVTALRKNETKLVTLFNNEWTNWIQFCYVGMGFNIKVSNSFYETGRQIIIESYREDLSLNLIEYTLSGESGEISLPKKNKTILIKIPINNLSLFNKLIKLNFKPVGIRVNIYKDDELVLQQLKEKEIINIAKDRDMKLIFIYSPKAKQMLSSWLNLVLQKKKPTKRLVGKLL